MFRFARSDDRLDMETKLNFTRLRNQLSALKKSSQVVALKTGTEIEDMNFEEISAIREISLGLVPMVVKIGGAEARNDMRNCLHLKINMILAPMIETVYALSNFIKSATEIQKESSRHKMQLAINLESITAYENLSSMIESTAFQNLTQITIGRGDLSNSMHLGVDDEEVMKTTASAVQKISNQGLITSVGGGLNISSVENLINSIPATRFNTRHMVLENNTDFKANPQKCLYNALRFEKQLYRELTNAFPAKQASYKQRIRTIESRMGNIELIQAHL